MYKRFESFFPEAALVGKKPHVNDEKVKLNVFSPTLVIAGTDDNDYMPHANALVIASKIPGAWLVQIKDAGHAVMNQYPAEISKILNTFLSTTGQTIVSSIE